MQGKSRLKLAILNFVLGTFYKGCTCINWKRFPYPCQNKFFIKIIAYHLIYSTINLVHEQIHLEYSCIMCIFNHNVGHQNIYIQTSTVYDE